MENTTVKKNELILPPLRAAVAPHSFLQCQCQAPGKRSANRICSAAVEITEAES